MLTMLTATKLLLPTHRTDNRLTRSPMVTRPRPHLHQAGSRRGLGNHSNHLGRHRASRGDERVKQQVSWLPESRK